MSEDFERMEKMVGDKELHRLIRSGADRPAILKRRCALAISIAATITGLRFAMG